MSLVGSLALAVGLLTAPIQPVEAQPAEKPPIPADLAFVHPNAMAFLHVRLADVWKHDTLQDARKLFQKAGPKALGALDTQFTPKPSSIDRLTTIVLPPEGFGSPPMLVVARFNEVVDQEAVKKSYLPKGTATKAGTKEFFADASVNLAVFFPDEKTIAFSEPKTMAAYLTWVPKETGGLQDAIAEAAVGHSMVAALNVARLPFPPGIEEFILEDARPLLKSRLFTVSMDIEKAVTVQGKLTFDNAGDAANGETAIRAMAKIARKMLADLKREPEELLFGKPKDKEKGARPLDELPMAIAAVAAIGGINWLDEYLTEVPVKTEGKTVTAKLTLPEWATQLLSASAIGMGLSLPAVQSVRQAAARSTSMNNLKQIALAMHVYHDANGRFPPAAFVDKKGKRLLSWRVAILPYIEQGRLYEQFKLDEPWDSKHNKELLKTVVKVYTDPRVEDKPWETRYKAIVGNDAVLGWAQSKKLPDISDGTSNTLLVVAAGDPVPWTKPDDFEFDAEKDPPDLTKPFQAVLAAFADGHVSALGPKTLKDSKKLKALITAAGGEVVTDAD